MYYKNETLKPIFCNGRFFDFFPKSGQPMIISYSRINKEILFKEDANQLVWGNVIKRKEIYSINNLRQVFDALICQEVELINKNGSNIPFHIDINDEDKSLIIDQLVFDILGDKYCLESPLMTLQQYSIYQSKYNRNSQTEKERVECVRRCISNGLKKQTAIMNSPELRNEIIELGVNPDEYFKYFNQVSTPFSNGEKQKIYKRPKAQWDYIYYSADTKLITGKQYDRSFSKGRNYSHNNFISLFNACDQYINELFMQPTEDNKSYFLKSLEFYYFEIYKRLDFIYKFAVRLDELDFPKMEKDCIFIKRFQPAVCDVLEQNGSLKFGNRIMYYRPMLMLEAAWLEKLYEKPVDVFKWQKHHFIRAKIYELFKYHFSFISNNYDEISDFIKVHYNILDYHDSNKIWIQTDKNQKRQREARIIKALEINEALFGASDKRNPVVWHP